MATARKLPSGNWRIRVYIGKDKNGKKIYKSFTAKTKREAQYMASDYLMHKKDREENGVTVAEATIQYIENKKNILSPTTIESYYQIKRNNFRELNDLFLNELNQEILQIHFNKLAQVKSPKTVHNAYGLLRSVMNVYAPEMHFNITLPQRSKKIKIFPAVEDILRIIKGTEIELPCLLAIWQGMRISEIRGARKSDISNGILTISEVIVTVNRKDIVKKKTKTYNSTRQLKLPEYILKLIENQSSEYLTELSGAAIYNRFIRLLKANNLPHITFHDLRHLNASVMLSLGIPDKYAMERGGWSSTNVMKSVYQHTFSEVRKETDKKIDDYFENLISE
ncbi:MAG: site-specific integrase [Oscillospiraceae bacterium]|nr:site-specific integrase [Oscillospiraceae bacterium]